MSEWLFSPKSTTCLSLLVVLTACSVEPMPGGGYSLTTTPIASLLTSPAADTTTATLIPNPALHAMNFQGPMDGGPGSATLTVLADSRYQVHLNLESNVGYGDVIGITDRSGNVFNMSLGHTQSSPVEMTCQIQMTLKTNQLQVWEHNCTAFHGDSVEFSGTLALEPS